MLVELELRELSRMLDSISGEIDKFFSQCPPGKRGRPMTLANAQKAEKSAPGSVCTKVARRRGVRGERSIFYRNTSWPKTPLGKKKNNNGVQDKDKEASQKSDRIGPNEEKNIADTLSRVINYYASDDMADDSRKFLSEVMGNLKKNGMSKKEYAEFNKVPIPAKPLLFLSKKSAFEFASMFEGLDITGQHDYDGVSFPDFFKKRMDQLFAGDQDYYDAKKNKISFPYPLSDKDYTSK